MHKPHKPRTFLPDDRLRQIAEDYLRMRWGEFAVRAVDTYPEVPFVQRLIVRRWELFRKLPSWFLMRMRFTQRYSPVRLREQMYRLSLALEELRNSRYELPVEILQQDVELLQERLERARDYGIEPVVDYCEGQLREAQQILELLEQNLVETS